MRWRECRGHERGEHRSAGFGCGRVMASPRSCRVRGTTVAHQGSSVLDRGGDAVRRP